ncbi:hypothetical protein C823_000735 [Eubacterium plexicaudatum ASF492]|nr:hypothetical protein C823_000735 [Eubacterium plexicaudatum ASF492]
MKVHYAMPLRNMTADALIYMKEYSETVKRNKQSEPLQNDAEFLSGLRREDRLHAVVTICVYYGETAWDGPYSLLDMLDMQHIPKQLRSFVNDYKINLIQIHGSEEYRSKIQMSRIFLRLCETSTAEIIVKLKKYIKPVKSARSLDSPLVRHPNPPYL